MHTVGKLSAWAEAHPDRVDRFSRFSINGFGILPRDPRERGEDGSMIITDWVMVAFFPVAPLRSRRIRKGRTNTKGVPGVASIESRNETTLEVLPVDSQRSLRVYLFYYLFLLPAIAVPLVLALAYIISIDFKFPAGQFWTACAIYLAWGIGCFFVEDKVMQP